VTAVAVRRLTRATGVPGLRGLVVAHAEFERSGTRVPDDWAARADPLVTSGRLALWVADSGGETIGYAALTRDVSVWTGEEYGHLDCLFVAEASRGSGAGRALLTAVRDLAGQERLAEVQWQTPTWNEPAIAFYEHAGATHVPKARFRLGTA
jgi:GNAT superfamily N-acetyltransferase